MTLLSQIRPAKIPAVPVDHLPYEAQMQIPARVKRMAEMAKKESAACVKKPSTSSGTLKRPKTDKDFIDWIAANPRKNLTTIKEAVGGSSGGVHDRLTRLCKRGILLREQTGYHKGKPVYLYEANPEYEPPEEEPTLVDQVWSTIKEHPGLTSAQIGKHIGVPRASVNGTRKSLKAMAKRNGVTLQIGKVLVGACWNATYTIAEQDDA